jgi:hypothetical protein
VTGGLSLEAVLGVHEVVTVLVLVVGMVLVEVVSLILMVDR